MSKRFGPKLRIWLIDHFKTLMAAAEALDMRQGDLSKYLSGKREPGFKFFAKIIKFNAPLYWLLKEDDAPTIDDKDIAIKNLDKKITMLILEIELLKTENKNLQNKLAEVQPQLRKFEAIQKYVVDKGKDK